MMVWNRLLGGAGIALGLALTVVPSAQAGGPRSLTDVELDRVAAGNAATQRQSVARLARLVGYQPQASLGFTDSPGETAIALLLPAVQAAREAARATGDQVGGGVFFSHAFTLGSSDPF